MKISYELAVALVVFSAVSGCCPKNMDVTVGTNAATGAELKTKVEFESAASCAVQHEIKRAVEAFSKRIQACSADANPEQCRKVANDTYQPLINDLLRINKDLATKGPAQNTDELINEAKRKVDKYVANRAG